MANMTERMLAGAMLRAEQARNEGIDPSQSDLDTIDKLASDPNVNWNNVNELLDQYRERLGMNQKNEQNAAVNPRRMYPNGAPQGEGGQGGHRQEEPDNSRPATADDIIGRIGRGRPSGNYSSEIDAGGGIDAKGINLRESFDQAASGQVPGPAQPQPDIGPARTMNLGLG